MPTGLESVLPFLPGATGYALLGVVAALSLRYAFTADKRWREEYADHLATQQRLDEERERRREAEDKVSTLGRQVEGLEHRVAELTTEVARLRGVVDGG
jgi:uncharacterized protein YlxW (UPF0749 family)